MSESIAINVTMPTIKESGKVVLEMDMESCNGQMELDMKDIGKITMPTGKGNSFMPLEMFMMENGLETRLMGLEPILALTLEVAILVIGKMISSMEKELKNGKMIATMRVNSSMGKRVV